MWKLSNEWPVLPSPSLMTILTYNKTALNCFIIMCSTTLAWMVCKSLPLYNNPELYWRHFEMVAVSYSPHLRHRPRPRCWDYCHVLVKSLIWKASTQECLPCYVPRRTSSEEVGQGPLISIMNFCLPKVPALLLGRNQYSSSLFVAQGYRYFHVFLCS